MKPISRTEWETMWAELKRVGTTMPLMKYAEHCNAVKNDWRDKFGAWQFDNGRYIVHVEEALAKGFPFAGDVSGDDMRYDAPAFPLVRAALAGGGS